MSQQNLKLLFSQFLGISTSKRIQNGIRNLKYCRTVIESYRSMLTLQPLLSKQTKRFFFVNGAKLIEFSYWSHTRFERCTYLRIVVVSTTLKSLKRIPEVNCKVTNPAYDENCGENVDVPQKSQIHLFQVCLFVPS